MILIKEINPSETYKIRKEELRKGIDLSCEFEGDFDKNTFHIGAFKNNELVAVASFMKRENNRLQGNQYQLRGMATDLSVRGDGFGKLLLQKAFEKLSTLNCEVLWCNAREISVGFYQKMDFKSIGKPFDIQLIGKHFVMVKYL